jgi:hypothetical protein
MRAGSLIAVTVSLSAVVVSGYASGSVGIVADAVESASRQPPWGKGTKSKNAAPETSGFGARVQPAAQPQPQPPAAQRPLSRFERIQAERARDRSAAADFRARLARGEKRRAAFLARLRAEGGTAEPARAEGFGARVKRTRKRAQDVTPKPPFERGGGG